MDTTLPPLHVNQKTVNSNLFSKHDNRHAFQSSGVYFGQGLGKKLTQDPKINQHASQNHTSWNSPTKYSSTYTDGYGTSGPRGGLTRRRCSSLTTGAALQPPHHCCRHSTLRVNKSLLDTFDVVTKENFRRFPHSHSLPDNLSNALVRPSEKTVWWHRSSGRATRGEVGHSSSSGDVISSDSSPANASRCVSGDSSYATPLSVLAATQQPFLKHNPWTFSYQK